jgi:hypothetical protein
MLADATIGGVAAAELFSGDRGGHLHFIFTLGRWL